MPPADTPTLLRLAHAPALLLRAGLPPVELAAREAAMLAWLALEGPTPRARVASLLWPDSDAEAARNALRQRLFRLRKQCGLDLVEGQVTLALAGGLQHDLLDAASVLGDAEPELGEDWAQWLARQRQQARQRHVARLAAQADAAEQVGQHDRALAVAQDVLALDPVSEVAHRRIIRLHYLRGDRAAALLAFDACERVLKDEVGARPDAQTLALLATVESAAPPAAPAAQRSLPPALMRPPQLIHRSDCVAQVLAALQAGQHVLVLAEAGVGKTRLMEECALALTTAPPSVGHPLQAEDCAQQQPGNAAGTSTNSTKANTHNGSNTSTNTYTTRTGAGAGAGAGAHSNHNDSASASARIPAVPVCRVGARPGDATRPFALLSRVLLARIPQPALLPADDRAALAWVVPSFGATPSPALEAGPFEAAVARALAGAGVLLVDDLHHGDAASIDLLLRCCDDPGSLRWVMAVRPAEVPAALQTWRDSASVARQPAEVRLPLLDEAGIGALLASLAVPELNDAAQPDGGLAAALARHTGGNPQFVLETVKALLMQDATQAFASGALPLPATVGRLIHQRLRQLSPGALKLARLAAVTGQDLSPELAGQVLGLDLLDLADPWAELEAAGVLRGTGFAHDLVSESTLETMPQVLAATLHGAVAQWLVQHGGEPGRIAEHWLAAHKEAEAVPWLMRAAAHASARIQLRDAARLYEQAADICRRHDDATGELAALEAAVDALFDVELGPRMQVLLERLQTMPLPDAERARALRSVAAVRHFRLEDEAAESLGREALQLALATGQRALEFRIRYGLVQVLSNRRDLAASQAVLEPLRDWVAREGDAVQRMHFQCMEGWVLLASERFEPARAAWQAVQRLAAELDRPRDQAMALNLLQVCWFQTGQVAAGLDAGLQEAEITRKHRLAGTRSTYLDLNLAISALLLGRYRESMAALARAEGQGVLDQGTFRLRRAALYLQLGQPARCTSELQPLLDDSGGASAVVRFNARLLHARWLLLHAGLGAAGREQALQHDLAQATALAATTGRVDHAARAMLLRGRLAAGAAQTTVLTEAVVLSHRHGLRGIESAAHACLARALVASGAPDEARQHIDTALALRDQGCLTDQMPGVELQATAAEVLAPLDPPRAATLLTQAAQWLQHTAQHEVPEAFVHGFLHLHPVHRWVLAQAGSLPPGAALPHGGQSPA